MRNLFALLCLASMSCLFSGEKIHHFSPKCFFHFFKDQEKTEKFISGGLEYHCKKDQGMNLKVSFLTNAKDEKLFWEVEPSLFYKFPISPNISLYPLLSSSFRCRKVNSRDGKEFFIRKNHGYVGIGCEIESKNGMGITLESHGFRHLSNGLYVTQEKTFWGKGYEKKGGIRGKVGIFKKWAPNISLNLDSHYSHQFGKPNKDMSVSVSFKRGF